MASNVVSPEQFRTVSRQLWSKIFGQRIEARRKAQKKSVIAAARLGGIGPDLWSELEAGRVVETWMLLEALARGLGMSQDAMASMARQCRQFRDD